jgi:hypothetical protein
MGCYAVPQIEKEFEGYTWRRQSEDYSFSTWHLTPEEERFLNQTNFYHWLGDEGTGYTELCIEEVEEALKLLKPEERFRIRELVHIIKTDIKENDGSYIQYNVG